MELRREVEERVCAASVCPLPLPLSYLVIPGLRFGDLVQQCLGRGEGGQFGGQGGFPGVEGGVDRRGSCGGAGGGWRRTSGRGAISHPGGRSGAASGGSVVSHVCVGRVRGGARCVCVTPATSDGGGECFFFCSHVPRFLRKLCAVGVGDTHDCLGSRGACAARVRACVRAGQATLCRERKSEAGESVAEQRPLHFFFLLLHAPARRGAQGTPAPS